MVKSSVRPWIRGPFLQLIPQLSALYQCWELDSERKESLLCKERIKAHKKGTKAQMSSNIWPQKALIEIQFNWKRGWNRGRLGYGNSHQVVSAKKRERQWRRRTTPMGQSHYPQYKGRNDIMKVGFFCIKQAISHREVFIRKGSSVCQ